MGDWTSFAAGSIAGATGIFVGHPFDSLKVRVQVGETLRDQKMDLATVRQLYRGVVPPIVTAGSTQAINFAVYEHCKSKIHQFVNGGRKLRPEEELYSLSTTFWGGTCSGAIISLLTSPIGMVKIQQQVVSEANVVSCIRSLYQKSGIRVFYRAYLSSFVMEAPGRGVYLWTYECVKFNLAKYAAISNAGLPLTSTSWEGIDSVKAYKTAPFAVSATAGACAGMFSWLVVYPLDVIKSRMQRDAHRQQFTSFWQCWQDTWRAGGIRSLYRGIGYTLLRAGPVAASILPVYDAVKSYLNQEFRMQPYSSLTE